ncbi:LysR substrate-binding domain-containing protein [Salipiger mucosus]|uniref:Regulatory protein, LysR:LysR, substrate-binding protein n=1 Tax=Salipiger mucosus DSM 16094 TaxID=1123237 RepID=S9RKU5_9RHOB|nr:LysR substrate-binding domain-containing protein [Salipiger mucosus]EPX78755.1 regulatory protein, LysR:LysR, substrate-binding protein [Salipiger mucosus DSM 16094]
MFELNHLRSFLAVAEELNFRRAAQRLNISQPPLSRHIAQLEHEIGARLFDRTNRSVRLTAAGKRLLVDATDILSRAESAALHARQAERGEVGSVVLGFVPSAAIHLVPQIAAHVRDHHPGIKLSLREMMTYEQIEALLAGTLEIGLFRMPNRIPSLPLTKVWSETFVLAVPRDHPLATAEHVTVEDLHDQPFIGFSSERGGFLTGVTSGFLSARGIVPRINYAVSQSHTIMPLVDAGFGLALVPASTRRICLPGTVIRDIDLPPDVQSAVYMGLGPRDPDPIVAEVAAAVEAACAAMPPDADPTVAT